MKNFILIRELDNFQLFYDKDFKCFIVKHLGKTVFNAGLDSQSGYIWIITQFMAQKDFALRKLIEPMVAG